jgi:hypothetical protein
MLSFSVYNLFLGSPWTVHDLFLGFRFVSDLFPSLQSVSACDLVRTSRSEPQTVSHRY